MAPYPAGLICLTGKLPAAMVKLQHLEGLYLFDNYIEGECTRALFCVTPLTGVHPARLCVLCAFSTSVVLFLCTSSSLMYTLCVLRVQARFRTS
jgi:hypothetical protein